MGLVKFLEDFFEINLRFVVNFSTIFSGPGMKLGGGLPAPDLGELAMGPRVKLREFAHPLTVQRGC